MKHLKNIFYLRWRDQSEKNWSFYFVPRRKDSHTWHRRWPQAKVQNDRFSATTLWRGPREQALRREGCGSAIWPVQVRLPPQRTPRVDLKNTQLIFIWCVLRSADIALVAGGSRKRWIIATQNMQAGALLKTSGVIGRMAGINLHWKPSTDTIIIRENLIHKCYCLLCSLSQWGRCVPTGSSSCGNTGEQLGGATWEGIRVHPCCR